jgi:hypothetical protein
MDLTNRTAASRIERKGVPCIAEMSGQFQSGDTAFDYLLSSDTISVPLCTCGRLMVHRARTYIYRCRPCNVVQSILKDTLFGNHKFVCTVVENRTAETLLPLIHK